MATMQVEVINPFIEAISATFDMMLGCSIERSGLAKKEHQDAPYEVNGIIGLSGKAVGAVVISLPLPVALKATSAMLMMEVEEMNEDVADAVGELANMVAGSAKAKLEELELQVSLPNVVTGNNIDIHYPSDTTPITIHFTSPWGPVALEVGFSMCP